MGTYSEIFSENSKALIFLPLCDRCPMFANKSYQRVSVFLLSSELYRSCSGILKIRKMNH